MSVEQLKAQLQMAEQKAAVAWSHYYDVRRAHSAHVFRTNQRLSDIVSSSEETDVERLKTHLGVFIKETQKTTECVVCLEPMNSALKRNDNGEYVCIMNCGHMFHKRCVHGFIRIDPLSAFKCPCCRSVITKQVAKITQTAVNPTAPSDEFTLAELGHERVDTFPEGSAINRWTSTCKACGETIPKNSPVMKHAKNLLVSVHPKCLDAALGVCYYADYESPISASRLRSARCSESLDAECLFSYRKKDNVRACQACAVANGWPGAALLGKKRPIEVRERRA